MWSCDDTSFGVFFVNLAENAREQIGRMGGKNFPAEIRASGARCCAERASRIADVRELADGSAARHRSCLEPLNGETPAVIVSVAHLDDEERALVWAFGVGMVLAAQNSMDLDCRALGNAGTWCIGRLQTDADRARVIDVMRDVHAGPKSFLVQTALRNCRP